MREIIRGRFEYEKVKKVWKLWFMYEDKRKKHYDTEHLEFVDLMSLFGYLMVYESRHGLHEPPDGG
jgi:hypothetical protein